jgi:hypothetical protein
MSNKISFLGLSAILVFSVLFSPAIINADQYYLNLPGNGFGPESGSASYIRSTSGYLYSTDLINRNFVCAVPFDVPDGSVHFIKSIGMRYKDNLTDGYIRIRLKRLNLFTGALHTLAEWESGLDTSSGSVQTASQGTIAGTKLVDTKKFAYYLYVYFYVDGLVNPDTNLMLYQVRVHYGT